MAEERPEYYKRVILANGKELESLGELEKGLKGAAEFSEKAQKGMRQKAYDYWKTTPGFDSTKKAENMDPKLVGDLYGSYKNKLTLDAVNILNDNFDDVMDQISESTLEKMTRTKLVNEAASGKNRDVINAYGQLQQWEDLMNRYNSGKRLQEEESELVMGLSMAGASEAGRKAEEKRQKDLGYKTIDSRLVDAFGAVTATAARSGYMKGDEIKKYANEGLKVRRKEIEDKYKGLGKASDAVKATLAEIRKKSPDQFATVPQLLYLVETGKAE